jgi:hypothetical protein
MQINEAGVFLQLDLAPGPQGLELPRVYEPVTEVSPEPLPGLVVHGPFGTRPRASLSSLSDREICTPS